MVISFSVEPAYNYLRQYGFVVTFRKSRRKRPNCETWCNRGRGKSKEFDVRISEICNIDPSEPLMESFAAISGFFEAAAWQDAIADVNGAMPDEGWLYMVVRQ